MKAIAAIALLTGAAVGGIVWFGWALAQNALAAVRKKPPPAEAELPKDRTVKPNK
ncbi:MAG: hypothetical protein NTU83_11260 [Candidatus Hydrogenedentes bacterium]|nr:hypothetical protein [Candidatus Hydrogenedentota bacterium]